MKNLNQMVILNAMFLNAENLQFLSDWYKKCIYNICLQSLQVGFCTCK